MEPMRNRLRRLFGNEKGATVVEYAVILALIIAVVYITIWAVGLRIQQGLENFNAAFEDARTSGSPGDGDQDDSNGDDEDKKDKKDKKDK